MEQRREDDVQEWLETISRLPDPSTAESTVIREIWKATLDPARRRRWSWVSMAFAVALGRRVADAEAGIGAAGWDGHGDLSKRLSDMVSGDPGIGLLVLFEGASISDALESVRTAIGVPDAKLREVAVAFRSDRLHLCRFIRIMYRDPHHPMSTLISPSAPVETVGKPPTSSTPATTPKEPELPAFQTEQQVWILRLPPDATNWRDVGLVTRRAAEALRPGTWVILTSGLDNESKFGAESRRREDGTIGGPNVEALALGRISRSPQAGGRLVTYDRLLTCEPRIPIPDMMIGSGPEPVAAPDGVLERLLHRAGCRVEDVPEALLTLMPEEVSTETVVLPRSFVASLVAILNSGKNVLLIGEQGSGKTATALALARGSDRAGLVEGDAYIIGGETLEQLQSSPLLDQNLPPSPLDYRAPVYGSGFEPRGRGTPWDASPVPKMLIVDNIQLDVYKALIRELDRRSRSGAETQRWMVIVTANPEAIMDESGNQLALTRQFLQIRIPRMSRGLADEAVADAGFPGESPAKQILLRLISLEDRGLTSGILSDTLRYLEARLGSDGRDEAVAVLTEALELCAFPYLAADSRVKIQGLLADAEPRRSSRA